MKADVIIDYETQKVKLILDWKPGIVGQNLTADEAEDVGIFAVPAAHRFVFVTPVRQPTKNIVFVRIDQRTRLDELFDDRLDQVQSTKWFLLCTL